MSVWFLLQRKQSGRAALFTMYLLPPIPIAVQQVGEIWGSISRLPLLILYRFCTRSSDRSINDSDTPSVLLFLNDEPSAKIWIIFDMLIYTIFKCIAVAVHYSNTLFDFAENVCSILITLKRSDSQLTRRYKYRNIRKGGVNYLDRLGWKRNLLRHLPFYECVPHIFDRKYFWDVYNLNGDAPQN